VLSRGRRPDARAVHHHHNTLDLRCFLADRHRAPPFKRLVVGGFERRLRTRPHLPQRGIRHRPTASHLGGRCYPAYGRLPADIDGAHRSADREDRSAVCGSTQIAYQGHADRLTPLRGPPCMSLVGAGPPLDFNNFEQRADSRAAAEAAVGAWRCRRRPTAFVRLLKRAFEQTVGSEPDPAHLCAGLRWKISHCAGPSQQAGAWWKTSSCYRRARTPTLQRADRSLAPAPAAGGQAASAPFAVRT